MRHVAVGRLWRRSGEERNYHKKSGLTKMKRQTPRSTKTEMTRLCDEQDQPKGQKEEDEGENDGEEKEGGIKKKKKTFSGEKIRALATQSLPVLG